ncbi:MAG: magnesium transporter [Tannerella sp.]|jgi:magnesium transporter|nr:magnesium transporter [Tannerella sp.]
MVNKIKHIHYLVEERDWKQLKSELTHLSPQETAEVIENLSKSEQIILFRLLSRESAKETFQYLSYEEQESIIEGLAKDSKRLTDLLNDLDPDDRTAFFEELPGKVSQRLMQMLTKKERDIATRLLGYPEESIGRLMTPDYVAIRSYFTVSEALEHIRRFGQDAETLNVIYVVDDQWRLVDDIKIRILLLASPDQVISELSDNRFVALNAYDDQEVAIQVFQDEDRVALPVVDSDGVLIGIMTIDDVMDIAEEESTEDFHKFGAIRDTIVNPLKARLLSLYKQRIVWLITLVFVNVFSGAAIAGYEKVIQSVVALVFFLPLLINSGGNAGSQSATLVIRSLAVGEIEIKDWFRLLSRELIVSLLLGLTMAAGVALIANLRAPEVMIVVALTMVLIVITGSLIGLLLPFIFTKLKMDPATASAPLISSISDITGILIYLSMATWYFGR